MTQTLLAEGFPSTEKINYPLGDLNPCFRTENPTSWAGLDEEGVAIAAFDDTHFRALVNTRQKNAHASHPAAKHRFTRRRRVLNSRVLMRGDWLTAHSGGAP